MSGRQVANQLTSPSPVPSSAPPNTFSFAAIPPCVPPLTFASSACERWRQTYAALFGVRSTQVQGTSARSQLFRLVTGATLPPLRPWRVPAIARCAIPLVAFTSPVNECDRRDSWRRRKTDIVGRGLTVESSSRGIHAIGITRPPVGVAGGVE